MPFIDDLGQPIEDSPRKNQDIRRELCLLSEFLALRCCRMLLLLALFSLAIATSIGKSHTPVTLYAMLCYFFLYLISSEWAKSGISRKMAQKKAQEFFLSSLCQRCRFAPDKLLTERLCFWFSFVLLAALQYAFLHTMELESILLTYSPPAAAVTLLLTRYLTQPLFRRWLRRQLMYRP